MSALLFILVTLVSFDTPTSTTPWWSAQVEASLNRLPSRKPDWTKLLKTCPSDHRAGLAFLLEYLPKTDLISLPTAELATNVELAYQARHEVPWGASLPEEIFLDAVLPHVSVTEPRQSSRREFHDRYLPAVKNCKSPGAAALVMNKTLFRDYNVSYNTKRLRTDQSSRESIVQGMATCTGLSIMLVEACRSVAIPARIAGIASWPGRGGNHTWVEIWDNHAWHFVGAAEPDDNGLDHAWFVADASRAIKQNPKNAIHAVTYRRTGEFFPTVWNDEIQIPSENVTDRYTKNAIATSAKPTGRLMVEVRKNGERVVAQVETLDRLTGALQDLGSSLGPQADVNNHLTCQAPPNGSFLVLARLNGQTTIRPAIVSGDTVVRLDLDQPIPSDSRAELERILADRFGTDATKKATAAKLLSELPWNDNTRALAWSAYKASPEHAALKVEWEAKTVSAPDRKSPYLYRHVGTKPAEGWGLVIAMHGGGGVPKDFNDSQWNKMFGRYKEHPEQGGGYVYLSLRAPNDQWNGFYDDSICPLIENLIKQFVLFDDVNPNRVYALGASHGGYGAFVIGPKIPYRFAAVHASAAAPTPGETRGENLRDLRFTFMVGENDKDYGRAPACQNFAKSLEGWKKQFGGYPGAFNWLPGVGHQVPDHDKLAEMFTFTRNPRPDHIIWAQTDNVLKNFYWIEAPKPDPSAIIEATVADNLITLKTQNQDSVVLWLDSPLINLDKVIKIQKPDGKLETFTPRPTPENFCKSLESRSDPALAAPVRIAVSVH